MNLDLNKHWAVEYSVNQRQFHVDTLEDAIANNRSAINEQRSTDYLIIGICSSRQEASRFIEEYQEKYKIPRKHSLSCSESEQSEQMYCKECIYYEKHKKKYE